MKQEISIASAASSSRDLHRFIPGAVVFVTALVIRLVYLYQSRTSPIFFSPVVDAAEYHKMAEGLANGGKLSITFFWQPLFYPLFLSGVYAVTQSSIVMAKILQIILGSITCLLVYRLGRKLFGKAAGIGAGIAAGLYGPMIFFDCELLATGWGCFWSVCLLLLFINTAEKGTPLRYLLLGLCGALSIITRPTFLPFFAAGCLWLLCQASQWVKRWRDETLSSRALIRIALLFLGFAIITVPVALKNRSISGHLTIMPYSGGINLYIGNNHRSNQTIAYRPGRQWDKLTLEPRSHGVPPGYETSNWFTDRVKSYIKTSPGSFIRNLGSKAVQFASTRELPRNSDVYLATQWSSLLRVVVWKVGQRGFPFGLLLPLVLVGAITCWRRLPTVLLLFLLLYPAAVILVFPTGRYRMPAIPAMLVVAAGGVTWLLQMIRKKSYARSGMALALIAVIPMVCSLAGPFPQETTDYESEMYYIIGVHESSAGRLKKAGEYLSLALAADPNHADSLNAMGVVFEKRGDIRSATEYYGRALAQDASNGTARNNLAHSLYRQGRISEALNHYYCSLKLNELQPEIEARVGLILARQQNRKEAIRHFKRSLAMNPNNADVQNNCAGALHESGKPEEAMTHYEAALALNPSHHVALENLSLILIQAGRKNEVVRLYQLAIEHAGSRGDKGLQARLQQKLADVIR